MTVDEAGVETVARALTGWVQGGPGMVVVESEAGAAWLAGEGSELVGADAVVVLAGDRGARGELGGVRGRWARAVGSVASDGADVALGADFFLETVGYARLQNHGIVGPTAARLFTEADAAALVDDVDDALQSGQLPRALVSRSVELGDQCAVTGVPTCAGRRLGRMHVDGEGAVRTSPAGRVLGAVGDRPGDLLRLAETAEPCLEPDVLAVLETARTGGIASVLAAVRVVRTLTRHRPSDWALVTGERSLLAAPASPVRSDLSLVTDGETFVVSDPHCRRPLKVGRAAAEAVEAVLATTTLEQAVELLSAGGTSRTVEELAAFTAAFDTRGVVGAHA